MPISIPSSPPFAITVGSMKFDADSNNIVRSIVVEDHVDMASFCSLMFDASADQGQVEAKIGRIYMTEGLESAFHYVKREVIPLFLRQEKKIIREAGGRK